MSQRKWLPRHLGEMGKRGQILATFGLVWVGIGLNVSAEGDPIAWATLPPFVLLPTPLRGLAWIITGLIALAYSLRPTRVHGDWIGFVALYLMPAWRVAAFTWTWLDSMLPLGGPCYPRGWLWAITCGCMVAAVMICATWPEPPRDVR